MAQPLDRTWYNALVDDDGSGNTGTVWNKTQVDGLLDSVDASLATVVDKSGAVVANEIPAFVDGDTIKGGSGVTAPGSGILGRTTAAGADNASVQITGAGALDATRGAYLYLTGNQAGSPGAIGLAMGNVAGAALTVFRGAGVSVLQILPTGVVNLLDGQLQFPATQKPSADSNTIDDYRELPWTPGVSGTGGGSGQTYLFQRGSYQKVGRWVTADFYLGLSVVGTILGDVTITGLPYANASADAIVRTCPIVWHDLNVAYLYLNGLLDPGATVLRVAGATVAHTSAITPPLAPSSLKAGTYLLGTIRYPTTN